MLLFTCLDFKYLAGGLSMFQYVVIVCFSAEEAREKFIQGCHGPGIPVSTFTVRRSMLYEDVVKIFMNETIGYPLKVAYENERAVDLGGVARDMLSGFWNEAYKHLFDGCTLLTPVIHPHVDLQVLPTIGKILSYGYIACGFIPLHIAFPTLVCLLLGPTTTIPDSILINSFLDFLSMYESGVIREAMKCPSAYCVSFQSKVVNILSRFGLREVPTPSNISDVIVKVARYAFLVKPMAAVSSIHAGIPEVHHSFWSKQSVQSIHRLYGCLSVTQSKVINSFEYEACNSSEERVLSYLEQFVGSMSRDVLQQFLRFTTGSSVFLSKKIHITFNSVSGFGRVPIGHTCSGVLEISSTYCTYLEFVTEFRKILDLPEDEWQMDIL